MFIYLMSVFSFQLSAVHRARIMESALPQISANVSMDLLVLHVVWVSNIILKHDSPDSLNLYFKQCDLSFQDRQ